MSANPFDRLAPFYDREHASFLSDLGLYLGLAERVAGPLLEGACGTGRLLVPLARAGYEVVGVDSSLAMLSLAEEKLRSEPILGQRARLVHGDLRTARLDRRFGLAIVALDSFSLLIQRSDQLRALRNLGRHLRSRGLLVIDVSNGNVRGGEAAEETTLHTSEAASDNFLGWCKWVVRTTDHGEQLDRLLHLYDQIGPDGVVRRTAVELELRYFTRIELELLLERAGFVVEAVFGDYDLTPYHSRSERLICVAHVRRSHGD